MSTGELEARYTPAELSLATLWFQPGEGNNVRRWLESWLPAHIQDIRRLLEQDHVRLNEPSTDLMHVPMHRTRRPENFSKEEVLNSYPGSYLAPPFRGFSYTNTGFRDWHVTDHRTTLEQLERPARRLHAQGALDWFYGVSAHGMHDHVHALLTFRHPHTQDWVREQFNLPPSAKLSPVHHDFGEAKRYLDNQATTTVEFGERPAREIFIDGNRIDIKRSRALDAIATGENTSVLRSMPSRPNREEFRAINMWVERAAAQPRVEHRRRFNSSAEALEEANRLATGYSGKVFQANFNRHLAGSLFKGIPPGWFGHEVVVFLNIPVEQVEEQLSARWLRAVPEVLYTVNEHPRPPAVVYTPPQRSAFRRLRPRR